MKHSGCVTYFIVFSRTLLARLSVSPHGTIFPAFSFYISQIHRHANLLWFLVEITKWVDDGSPVDVGLIYLDFQKESRIKSAA